MSRMRLPRLPAAAALIAGAAALLLAGCGEKLPTPSDVQAGYDRVVLGELLTTTWCGWCPTAEGAMDRLFDEEGPERLAVIHWHPSYGQGDPFAIPESDARAALYADFLGNPPGFPLGVFDGLASFRGGWAGLYDDYRERYELEAGLGSLLRITLDPDVAGNSATVAVTIETLPDLAAGSRELIVAAVEHHAVAGADTSSYIARRATTESVNLSGGQTLSRTVTLDLAPEWKRQDLWLVGFIQEPQPAPGGAGREVLQAAMVPLIAAAEDFFAFLVETPDTTVSLTAGGERAFVFSLRNTGTLDDTLTVDLPAALIDAPTSWSLGLLAPGDAELVLPSSSPIAAGELIAGLQLHVLAPTAGSATARVVVSSWGDPALADTLTFHIAAGVFGLALSAVETDLDVLSGVAALAPFTLANTGSVEDSLEIDLPDSLSAIPAGWQVSLADAAGNPLASPTRVELGAGGSTTGLRLRILAPAEGRATIGLTAASRGNPSLVRYLAFTVEARMYNFDLAAEEPDLQMVVGTPVTAPFTLRNTGARSDLLRLDLPADLHTAVPDDWDLTLVYGEDFALDTPHDLLLEPAQATSSFGVRILARSAGVATVSLVATSAGDPSLSDTLRFAAAADEYGFELGAPEGLSLGLRIGEPRLAPITIANTGTVDDILEVDVPLAGIDVPAGWEAYLADAAGQPLAVPLAIALASGASHEGLRLRALAPSAGSGSVQVVAASRGAPALRDTLTFTLSVSQYGLALTAPQTTIHVSEYPVFAVAHFTLANTGLLDDQIDLALPPDQQTMPPTWDIPIICEEGGICFGPYYSLPLAAGQSTDLLYVDVHVTAPGTGIARLIATSRGDPTITHTLEFTFTTEALHRSATPASMSMPAPAAMTPLAAGMASPSGDAGRQGDRAGDPRGDADE